MALRPMSLVAMNKHRKYCSVIGPNCATALMAVKVSNLLERNTFFNIPFSFSKGALHRSAQLSLCPRPLIVSGHTSSWKVWRYLRANLIAEHSNKAKKQNLLGGFSNNVH